MNRSPSERGASRAAHGHHVQIEGAIKRYGTTTALAGVDVDVEPGQFLVLLGPSGSGKSTLLRGLAGIDRFDSGRVWLSGQLAAHGRRQLAPERRDLAMVFQDYALWPHLTVAHNVGYALRRRHLSAATARQRVYSTLERVGLASHADRYPHALSGGEQQRVALARAVVAEPRLLLFDEPLSNLDADLRERLRVEIATLTRESGASAVYITHDQAEAFALADRVGVLDRGRLMQLAAPEQVYRRPTTPFVARFTGLAGDLPGVAAQADANTVHAQVGRTLLGARCIGDIRPGNALRVLVRPAATHITGSVTDAGDREPANSLAGVVTDVAYRGRGYDHVVECDVGTLTAVHSLSAYPRATRVRVELDPDQCLAYVDQEAGGSHNLDVTDVRIGRSAELSLVSSNPTRGSA